MYGEVVRIGIVCPYSVTVPGGVQGQVLGLARSLRALGLEARVLAPADGPPPDAAVTPLGASIPLASNGSVAPIAPDPSCALRTIRALHDEGFDVLHLHEPLVPGPTLTSLLLAPAPVVGTFHAAGTATPYRYVAPIARRLARRIDVRVAVSPDARDLAHEHLGGDYELLFNGIDVEPFSKATPHPTEAPTIFFLGRHEPRKGLDVLIAAVRRLPPDVRLWVAGDGPQTPELRATTDGDPRIEWLGRVSDDERAARMRGADVFCAPSLHGESFGVILLEAMAAGTPVVASDLAGYRNVATNDHDALLVPPGDDTALAAAIRRVLESASLAERLVEAGRARAQELSMDRLAERYVELYARLV